MEQLISETVKERLAGGVVYGRSSTNPDKPNNMIIIDIPRLEKELKRHISANSDQILNNNGIDDVIESIKIQLHHNFDTDDVMFLNNKKIKIPFVLTAKIQNGKVIERKFGTKENGQQYTTEEVKVILKEAEEIESKEKFKDGRKDKFTFLSLIADMDNNLIGENSKNPIRFITPDNNNKNEVYKEIQKIVEQAGEKDSNYPNILLIPYSANGHIVTLLVDKKEFSKGNGVACFDSSHYFTSAFNGNDEPKISSRVRIGAKYITDHHIITSTLLTMGTIGVGIATGIVWGPVVGVAYGIIVGTTGIVGAQLGDGILSSILTGDFNKECFPDKLYGCMIKEPINDKIIQGLNGTCSFYTEAFCYIMSDYIRQNPQKTLDDVKNYINTEEFEKKLKKTKTKFFNQYKTTMKKVEKKQQKEEKLGKLQHVNQPPQKQTQLNTPDTHNTSHVPNSFSTNSENTIGNPQTSQSEQREQLERKLTANPFSNTSAHEVLQEGQYKPTTPRSQTPIVSPPSRSSTPSLP